MMNHNAYVSPFSARYASDEMQHLFSSQFKFSTWRLLWVILAESERELTLPITEEQIDEMRAHIDDIDFEKAEEYEKRLRHDVMAHVHAYGDACKKAMPIIHLGATSCYVGDNTDIIIMRKALELIRARLVSIIRTLRAFAMEHRDLPTLAFTHFQPAQPTTVGKRAALWLNDLMLDLNELEFVFQNVRPLGCKGTTGTQASFLELFDGDEEKVFALDQKVCAKMGCGDAVPISGQTYSRKTDSMALNLLSQIAQSAHKFSNDIRLLAHMKEIEEPFGKDQVGSSAMAYKRNPMRSERIASLSRHIIINAQNAAFTAASQWFERTLDDSANKRIAMAEGFLACDAVLLLYQNVASGLVVYPKVIEKHLNEELPFMATENIMMDAVKRGGDRQEVHERIRRHAMDAAEAVKLHGEEGSLLARIASDALFGQTEEELQNMLSPEKFIGCAKTQVERFIDRHVDPLLEQYKNLDIQNGEPKV